MRRGERGRGLRAVVFLDTVGSTQIAAALGDERWQTLLRRELRILRRLLKERGGEEVDVAGDGLFALFREPSPAVRFAASAAEAVREIGLEIRAGIHFGEVEFSDGRPAGIVVHTGARAMSLGGAGDVIVTQGVRDLLAGGHLAFSDEGVHELKGVPGTWHLYRLSELDGETFIAAEPEDEAQRRMQEASEPSAVVRRRTFVAGLVVALAGGIAGTYLLTRGNETPRAAPRANRLLRFDPSDRSLRSSPVVLPSLFFAAELPSLAIGEGALWAGDRTGLHQFDPRDGSLRNNFLPNGGPVAMSIGFDDLWAADGDTIRRIDPADGEILDRRVFAQGASTTGVLVAFGDVWITFDNGLLVQLSPAHGLPVEGTIPVGDLPNDLVQAAGAVWVTDGFGTLTRVDPRDGGTERRVLGGAPQAVAATEDALWVADLNGVVVVLDPNTMGEKRSVAVGGHPIDIATGLDTVWVADQNGRLIWLDPADPEVQHGLDLDAQAAAIAVDDVEGVVWIRTFSGPPSP